MAFEKVASLDDLPEGAVLGAVCGGQPVLLARLAGGEVTAFQGNCPHQDVALAEGEVAGEHIRCRAHRWVFSLRSGEGLNPLACPLARFPVRIEGRAVLVDVAGIEPLRAQC